MFSELFDDRYGYPGRFGLYACRNCRHKFVHATFDSREVQRLYSNYYPRSSQEGRRVLQNYKIPHLKGLGSWLDGTKAAAFYWVKETSRVLDIGCGSGQSLVYLKHLNCQAEGIEADSNVRSIAEEMGLKIRIGVFEPGQFEDHSFDFVTMSQVFEHISQPKATLEGIGRILAPRGRLILSIPNAAGWGARVFGNFWINWHVPYHLHFYSLHSLEAIANQSGFKILSTFTLTPSDWLNYQWNHLFFYPKNGTPSEFWKPTDNQRHPRWKKVISKLLNLMHRLKVNHVLTRLMDSLRLGDNRIVILQKLD